MNTPFLLLFVFYVISFEMVAVQAQSMSMNMNNAAPSMNMNMNNAAPSMNMNMNDMMTASINKWANRVRIRRDFRDLSPDQWTRVKNALTSMYQSAANDPNHMLAQMLVMHLRDYDQLHFKPPFLPVHRRMVYFMENMLFDIDPLIEGFPYWNTAKEDALADSWILLPEYLGLLDSQSNCVFPIGNWYEQVAASFNRARGRSLNCAHRVVNPRTFIENGDTFPFKFKTLAPAWFMDTLVPPQPNMQQLSQDDISHGIEFGLHALVHDKFRIGYSNGTNTDYSDMGLRHAALDPIFFFHHANIDRIWAYTQNLTRTANGDLKPTDDNFFNSVLPGGMSQMRPADLWDSEQQLHVYYIDISQTTVSLIGRPEFLMDAGSNRLNALTQRAQLLGIASTGTKTTTTPPAPTISVQTTLPPPVSSSDPNALRTASNYLPSPSSTSDPNALPSSVSPSDPNYLPPPPDPATDPFNPLLNSPTMKPYNASNPLPVFCENATALCFLPKQQPTLSDHFYNEFIPNCPDSVKQTIQQIIGQSVQAVNQLVAQRAAQLRKPIVKRICVPPPTNYCNGDSPQDLYNDYGHTQPNSALQILQCPATITLHMPSLDDPTVLSFQTQLIQQFFG